MSAPSISRWLYAHPKKAVSAYLKWLEIMADDEVAAFWDLIERTAHELFERRTLSAAEIVACCRKPAG